MMPSSRVADTDIAVIGMAGRFPGAQTPAELWANVRAGVESIRQLSDEQLRMAGVDETTLADPHYIKACAPLDDVARFDGSFFGFSPKESAILDPQHRQFLECSWEALESAGYPPETFDGSIGVFAGCGMNGYFIFNLLTNPDLVKSVGLFLLRHTGNDKDFLPTRVSYLLNLTGPSIAVQTACSTSLVAIHLAAQHLISGECDMALAGGVTIEVPHEVGYMYEEGEILSPDGHCRAFDAASKGTVFGSGVGVVVLRRLQDALDAGDTIHAVVKGSAVNNDGGSKVGYLAPSVDGQAACVLEALAVSGVTADQISYVEAHGTGTPVGDPIEVAALTQAFRQHTTKTGFCGLGSLKNNIGHLDTAAGVANFIKVVEALKHRELPPSIHFERANPAIDFAATPFYVNARLQPWPTSGGPRTAGVSALGVGGTNAHVIVQEAMPAPAPAQARSQSLVLISAKTDTALDALTAKYARHFEASDLALADAAYTTTVGRRAFDHRRIVVGQTTGDVAIALGQASKRLITGVRRNPEPSVVMLFPGGGAQYPSMGADLYREEPRFREEVDRCLDIAARLGHTTLRSLMFPQPDQISAAARHLERPRNSVLSVFIIEYALAQLWMMWGVKPAAFCGHSLGEYTAACLAGVMSLESALALVSKRGELFERLPEGAMLSVPLSEAALRETQELGSLVIASVNAPELVVVSGLVVEIDALQRVLAAKDVESTRLHISVAAHSPMLDPMLDEFRRFVEAIPLDPPAMPFVSNVSGSWVEGREVARADYWVRHLRSTVRFSEGLMTVLEDPNRVLLEVGPGQTLTALARLHRAAGKIPVALPSLRRPHESVSDLQTIYEALGGLWVHGGDVDWDAFYASERRRRVELPTYAFDRQRHWIAPGLRGEAKPALPKQDVDLLPRLDDISDWVRVPVWRPLPSTPEFERVTPTWLVLTAGGPLGMAVVTGLEARDHRVVAVAPGQTFAENHGRFTVRPTEADDYRSMLGMLERGGRLPEYVLHLWLAELRGANPLTASDEYQTLDERQAIGFEALFSLLQALAEHVADSPLCVSAVTAGLFSVAGERTEHPDQATVLGPALVAPREYPSWRCRVVDIPSVGDAGELAGRLLREMARHDPPPVVALRDGSSWARTFEKRHLQPASVASPLLRTGGTYLITGGLGGMALTLADHLAERYQAKLGLLSRLRLSTRVECDEGQGTTGSEEIARADAFEALERKGATVVRLTADVTDTVALAAAIADFEHQCGEVQGVIHAAGILDDGLLAVKTLDAARAVLAPKVSGTVALAQNFGNRSLDFFLLCSSTSALVGLPGQVDYSAANAFLDAFAQYREASGLGRTIAINWGGWRDVGMAARAVAKRSTPSDAGIAVGHPLLGRLVVRTDTHATFQWTACADTLWVLSEHRLKNGVAVLPGTGYIELARAACQHLTDASAAEISGLIFMEPLEVPPGEARTVRVQMERRKDKTWEILVESAASDRGPWDEHARATVRPFRTVDPESDDSTRIRLLMERCSTRLVPGSDRDVWDKQSRHIAFGPRWNVVRETHLGAGEVLVRLVLNERFHRDLDTWRIHPALLDFATASALAVVEGYETCPDFFVPFACGRVVAGPMGAAVWAHASVTPGAHGSAATILIDVNVYDGKGRLVASVEEFAMRRLPAGHLTRRRTGRSPAVSTSAAPLDARSLPARLLEHGIAPTEGALALERVLQSNLGSQVVVSSVDLGAIEAALDTVYPHAHRGTVSRAGRVPRSGFADAPALDETEAALVAIWKELLGVDGVGPDDDFFDLGGHSLLSMRVATRVQRRFGASVPLVALFEARTVRQLAALLQATPPDMGPTVRTGEHLAAVSATPALKAVSRDTFKVDRSSMITDE